MRSLLTQTQYRFVFEVSISDFQVRQYRYNFHVFLIHCAFVCLPDM
jgi:hypothetical protein